MKLDAIFDQSHYIRAAIESLQHEAGSAAVLAAGEMLASRPRKRNVLLEFWSGEEMRMMGS